LETWGIQGTIQVVDVVQFTPAATSQSPNRLALNSVRRLARPDIIDRVTDHVHFNNLHNDKPRVRAIINGMDVFVLTAPNTRITSNNLTVLEDDVQSSEELCDTLIGHLLHAETLPPDRLPLEVPVVLYAQRMQTHPYAITGSFAHVKKVDNTNAIEIPFGRDNNGAPITDPVIVQPPALPPILAAPPQAPPPVPGGALPVAGPVVGNVPDPNAALI